MQNTVVKMAVMLILVMAALVYAQPRKRPQASWLKLSDKEIVDSMRTYGLYGEQKKYDLKELQSMAKSKSAQEIEQHYKEYEAYFKKIDCLALSSPSSEYRSKLNLKKIDALKATGFDPLRLTIKIHSRKGLSDEEYYKLWDDGEIMGQPVILLCKYTKRTPLKKGYHRREYVVTEILRDYFGLYKIGMVFSSDFYWDEEAQAASMRSVGINTSARDYGVVGGYVLIKPKLDLLYLSGQNSKRV